METGEPNHLEALDSLVSLAGIIDGEEDREAKGFAAVEAVRVLLSAVVECRPLLEAAISLSDVDNERAQASAVLDALAAFNLFEPDGNPKEA